MKLYVVVNSQGQFFKPKGFGGGSSKHWNTELEKAKFYPKIGHARAQCNFWYQHDSSFGCPKILEFSLDASAANIIDPLNDIIKARDKKMVKQQKQQIAHQEYLKEEAQKEVERLKKKYKL